jgi:xylan 1,4-beta-xylosidase
LGNTELANTDSTSWTCKDAKGNIQILAYDFTNTHPGDSVNNQVYYIRDLPPKSKGKLKIKISKVPEGRYSLETYKVGYRSNDAYTSYYDMGRPPQLTKVQVEQIKKQNNGSPVSVEVISIKAGVPFSKDLELRENDVFFLNLVKL